MAWILLAIVLFCMPTAIPTTPVSMNYAPVVFVGFALISVIWYIIRGGKEFTGPPVPADVEPEQRWGGGRRYREGCNGERKSFD